MDTETVTVVRPPARGRFGDPLPGSGVEVDVAGCLYAPGTSVEADQDANTVLTDGTVYGPAGMDVRATDLLRIRAEMYEVVGVPQNWGSAGTVIPVRRRTG